MLKSETAPGTSDAAAERKDARENRRAANRLQQTDLKSSPKTFVVTGSKISSY